jgi:hypothetical protein
MGLVDLIRLAGAGLLIVAALHKIRFPHEFLRDVLAYRLLPEAASVWAAVVVPWIELTVAACLIAARPLREALVALGLLGLVFVAAQSHALLTGKQIACGCFGGDSPVGARSVALAGGLALSALVALALTRWIEGPRPTSKMPADAPDDLSSAEMNRVPTMVPTMVPNG